MLYKKKSLTITILLLLLLISGCGITGGIVRAPRQKAVREPVAAGQFYPQNSNELYSLIKSFLDNTEKTISEEVHAIIVPHAGYQYSGEIAAKSFKQLDRQYERVFVIASNHNSDINFNGISLPIKYTHYKTPLGETEISKTSYELLNTKSGLFKSVEGAHDMQMIEVELPFLQALNPNFKLIPMILGKLTDNQIEEFVNKLLEYDDGKTLYVFSIDLSHYYPYNEALKLDGFCLGSLMSYNYKNINQCITDGNNILLAFLQLAVQKNLDISVVDYKNSGDTTGNKESVVGYSSVVAHNKTPLSNSEKSLLLSLARDTIELYVKDNEMLEPKLIFTFTKLFRKKGLFVSLEKDGILRGSIGSLMPVQPMYLAVRDNAINAATKDTRFEPVQLDELDKITITVSVLDIPILIKANNWQEYLDQLTPLEDGVIIVYNNKQSTYLPQVWEQLPDKEGFLSRLCLKQGSPEDCWKSPNVDIYKYSAQVFSE